MDLRDAVAQSLARAHAGPSPGGPAPGASSSVPFCSGDGKFHDARGAAERALARASVLGITPIPWADPRYPTLLSAIADAPAVLWAKGRLDTLASPAVAIVGSRAASPYARDVAERLAGDLVERGVTVVSGMARGVDSAAHRGALAAGAGRTIAVLGSGVDVIYPREHAALARDIEAAGLLLSELAPGTPPRAFHFPWRNRIISGLSLAIVVVEASENSGSLITARCGLEHGREVMAVPGNVLTGRNRGSHALLKDGAKVVEHADDILEELGFAHRGLNPEAGAGRLRDQDPLLNGFPAGEALDLDALIDRTGLSGPKLLPRLLELELKGRIRRVEGGRFVRVDRKVVT